MTSLRDRVVALAASQKAPLDYQTALRSWPPDWRTDWEERAAIMEYEAGMSRTEAERRAFAIEIERHRKEGRLP